jgi:exopolyphosphatase/guanosine-5'-triphosphate,3'-diphosphate pyrophosphatase
MTGDRIAVIDLGSNTFHLLICEVGENGKWRHLLNDRDYVKLAEGGMNVIEEEAIERAIKAMVHFKTLIESYKVGSVRAIGTAALRESQNGIEVAQRLSSISGIQIEIIDGQQEANYILDAIRSALPNLDQYGLIMDIGGGSVEFILFKGAFVAFAESFKIGVAILYNVYHRSDPIRAEEIIQLENELDAQLQSLKKALQRVSKYYLIGASGSFEILREVLPSINSGEHWAELELTGIEDNMNKVIMADLEARESMPEIPVERRDYIVVAYILIRYLFRMAPPEKLYYCDFALKEGVVEEMLQ